MKKPALYLNEVLILRNPLLPFETLKESTGDGDALIKKYWSNVYIKNGILLSSYDFYLEVEGYLRGEKVLAVKKKKIQETFFKYFSRMCTRCTPFGLFSSVSPIYVREMENVSGEYDENKIYAVVNLHYQLLSELVSFITRAFRHKSRFTVNRSLSDKNNKFIVSTSEKLKNRTIYATREIESNEIIEFLFKNKGEVFDYNALIQKLVSTFSFHPEGDIKNFIDDCIDQGVMVNAVSTTGRGKKTNHEVIYEETARLYSLYENNPELRSLIDIFRTADRINARTPFKPSIDEIISKLKTLGIPYDRNKIIFVNSHRDGKINLGISGTELSATIMEAMAVSTHFLTQESSDGWFEDFKKRFVSIFGDAMVSFETVFDPITGLNYPLFNQKKTEKEILLTELRFNKQTNTDVTVKRKKDFFHEKYLDCLVRGKEEMIIKDDDLLGREPVLPDLSYTFSMLASIVQDPDKRDLKPCIHLKNVSGGSALGYIGRFSGLNEKIHNLCQKISRFEEETSGNAINAEITHIPDPAIGDILFHNPFHKYEIPYLVNSHTNPAFIMDMSDLLLGVQDERFVIYSKKHRQYVNPILANAYNFSLNEHPAFMFLCDYQHRKSLFTPNISLGHWAASASFLPRVRYKNVVFSPKTWVIDLQRLLIDKDKTKNTYEHLTWHYSNIPKQIQIGHADQLLHIDFDDAPSRGLFASFCDRQLKKGIKKITVFESLIPKGYFANEIILTYNYAGNAR